MRIALRALAVALALSVPATSRAQQRECDVQVTGVKRNGVVTTTSQTIKQPSGRMNVWVGGGVDGVCAGTDQRLLSDSLEQYPDQNLVVLIGHVHYIEERIKLDSDRLTYYTNEERIVVEGNVLGTTPGGTRFTAPRAEYLRPAEGIRTKSRLTAGTRAHVWLSPKDAGDASRDTVLLQADRIISDNDSLVYAMGRVIIERPDIVATGDSAYMDNGREYMQLSQLPIITGVGDRQFTLVGIVIDAWSRKKKLTRVRASGTARATSDEVILSADSIDLRMKDQKIDRAYAWGPLRARATSTDRDITADSLDITMPDQELKEVRAVRGAHAESPPDTARIVAIEPDWISGDTITATFERVAGADADTAKKNAVKEIVANGKARSFYQAAGSGQAKTATPNINYVSGRLITLSFEKRQLQTVHVKDQAEGLYLEAPKDSTQKPVTPADSASRAKAAKALSPAPKKP